MISVCKLVEDPEHSVHVESFGVGQLAQGAVAGEQGPSPGMRYCEGECIRHGKSGVLPPDRRRSAELGC